MSDFEQTCAHIVQLYERYDSQESQSELMEFYKSPDALFHVVAILENSDVPKIQDCAALGLLALTHDISVFDQELIIQVSQKMPGLIAKVQTGLARRSLIDRAFSFALAIEDRIPFYLAIAEVANSLLENPQTLPESLRAWGQLVFIQDVLAQFNQFLVETLFPIALSAFQAEEVQTRKEAYSFVILAIVPMEELENDEKGVFPQELQERIAAEISQAVVNILTVYKTNEDAYTFSKALSEMIPYALNFIEEILEIFPQIIIQIADENISESLKLPFVYTLEAFLSICPESFFDSLSEYVPVMIKFVIELANNNPEENEYQKCAGFFSCIANAIEDAGIEGDEGEQIGSFTFFFPLLQELLEMQDAAGYLTAFMIFTAILYEAPAAVIELYDDIEGIIAESLNSESTILTEAALNFLESLVQEAPTIAPHIQKNFESLLLAAASNDLALKILANVYEQSEIEPNDPNAALTILLEQFSSTSEVHHELTFEAVSSIVSHMNDIPEELYPSVKPIIDELIESGTGAIGKALEGFSKFATCFPALVVGDLEQIVPVLIEVLQKDDIKLVFSALTTATAIFQSFPFTLAEQRGIFFENALRIAKATEVTEAQEEEENDEDDDQENKYEEKLYNQEVTYCTALVLSAFIYSSSPEQFADQTETLKSLILHYFQLDKSTTVAHASKATIDLLTGMAKLGIDPLPFFHQIFYNDMIYLSTEDMNTLDAFWDSTSYCVRILPRECVINEAHFIVEVLDNILRGVYSLYNKAHKENNNLNHEIVKSILTMVEELLIQLEGEFGQYIETIIPGLIRILNDSNPVSRCYAATTISMIASFFPEFVIGAGDQFPQDTDIASIALSSVTKDMTCNYQEVQANRFLALHFIALANKNLIASMAQLLIQQCMEAIRGDSASIILTANAAILWGTLVQIFQVTPSAEDLTDVLNQLPVDAHNYRLRFNSSFIVYALQNWTEIASNHALKIAVTVLGSDDILQNRIPREEAAILAQVISSSPEAETQNLARNNEQEIDNIKRHMEALSQ